MSDRFFFQFFQNIQAAFLSSINLHKISHIRQIGFWQKNSYLRILPNCTSLREASCRILVAMIQHSLKALTQFGPMVTLETRCAQVSWMLCRAPSKQHFFGTLCLYLAAEIVTTQKPLSHTILTSQVQNSQGIFGSCRQIASSLQQLELVDRPASFWEVSKSRAEATSADGLSQLVLNG